MERVRFVHAADGQRLALTEPASSSGVAGEAFLFIHGFAQNRMAFGAGPIPQLFAERGARVFFGELRGHGRSAFDVGAPPEVYRYSLSTHLDVDLPALIELAAGEAGVERVHLVGHSMGGILGYALLSRPHAARLASLTTFAAPLALGVDRPLMRLASLVAMPALAALRPAHVPMDWFLRSLAPILCDPHATGSVRLFQKLTRLVSPAGADPELLAEILSSSDRESPLVFAELARAAITGRAEIAGVDLVKSARASPLPIAAVFGVNDVFTARRGLAALEEPTARGPRLVLELPDALHVDVTCGPQAPRLVAQIWDFVVRA